MKRITHYNPTAVVLLRSLASNNIKNIVLEKTWPIIMAAPLCPILWDTDASTILLLE